MLEKKLIEALEAADGREVKYVAIDLITESYDTGRLVNLAKAKGLQNRLGYLAEVSAKAAENSGIEQAKQQLKMLVGELYKIRIDEFAYLSPKISDAAKRICASRTLTHLNEKWKVYSSLTPNEIEDWIDLYVTENYATASRGKTTY